PTHLSRRRGDSDRCRPRGRRSPGRWRRSPTRQPCASRPPSTPRVAPPSRRRGRPCPDRGRVCSPCSSGLLTCHPTQPPHRDLPLLRGRVGHLLVAAVGESLLGDGQHLVGGLPRGEDEVDEPEPLLVGTVHLGETVDDLPGRRTGTGLLLRGDGVAPLTDPRMGGERLEPVLLG